MNDTASLTWLLLRPYVKWFAALLVVITLGAVAEALGLVLLSGMLSVFLGGTGSAPAVSLLAPLYAYARESPRLFMMALLGVYIVKSVLAIVGTYGSYSLALRITDDWRRKLLRALMRAPLTRLDGPQGTMVQIVLDEPGSAALGLGSAGLLAQNLFATLTVYVVLLYVSWQATVGLTVMALLGVLLVWVISRSSIALGQQRSAAYKDGYAYITEIVSAIKQLRIFALEGEAQAESWKLLGRMRRLQLTINMVAASPRLLIELLFLCGLAVTVVVLMPRMGEASILSALGLAVVATVRLLPSFAASASTWVQMQQAWPSMVNIARELHRLESAGLEQTPSDTLRSATFERGLTLRDVHFTYPDRQPALIGVDLEIPRGTFVALVGPSGSGKSTVIDLVCGFHRPGGGEILVDGVDLNEIALSSWRRQLGVVLQDGFLFSGTIRENLCLLRPECTDEQLREAIAMVGAEPFIRDLPKGLDTRVGDRGVRFSGGQRQRLALARTFLAEPPLLILDEAMSALDLDSEEALMAALDVRRGRMTMVVVAHRLSAVRRADRIFVLDRGRVVESGTHESLLLAGGVYARMWRSPESSPAGATRDRSPRMVAVDSSPVAP